MKEMEMELPQKDDSGTVARVKRMHFYSVREEFIIIWNFHEVFLVDYEERLVRRLRNQAKIGELRGVWTKLIEACYRNRLKHAYRAPGGFVASLLS